MTQAERTQHFQSLHIKGEPLMLFNVWDAGSAQAIQDIGAKALATSSFTNCFSIGYLNYPPTSSTVISQLAPSESDERLIL